MRSKVAEADTSLWVLAVPPFIWAAHFLLSYWTAAIWCAKFAGGGRSLSSARVLIAVYTVVALTGLAAAGRKGLRQQRIAQKPPPHDADTAEDRTSFLGYATLLLAGLGAIAVSYAAMVAVFIRSCH